VIVIAQPGKCWDGPIGSSTKQGCGQRSYVVPDDSTVALAQKHTVGRWQLCVRLERDGALIDRSCTDADFGIAQVSG
jgi:hypothetical protein